MNLKGLIEEIREKRLILTVLFLIPLFTSIIFGFQFTEGQIRDVPAAVVDLDGTYLSRKLIEEIRTNEVFDLRYYCRSYEEMKELFDTNRVRMGLIIPHDFSKELKEFKAPRILVFYDGSQMSITGAAKARMTEMLLTLKSGFLLNVFQGKLDVLPEQAYKNVVPMSFETRVLHNPTRNYAYFLIPGVIAVLIQVGFAVTGVELVRKDDYRFLPVVVRNLFFGLPGAICMLVALLVQVAFFHMPFRGSVAGGIIITYIFATSILALGSLVGSVVPDKVFATQVAAVMVLPSSILGGYTWPLLAMPQGYRIVGNLLPYTHYAETIRDLTVKDIGIKYVLPEIMWLSGFLFTVWGITFVVCFVRRTLLQQKVERETAV